MIAGRGAIGQKLAPEGARRPILEAQYPVSPIHRHMGLAGQAAGIVIIEALLDLRGGIGGAGRRHTVHPAPGRSEVAEIVVTSPRRVIAIDGDPGAKPRRADAFAGEAGEIVIAERADGIARIGLGREPRGRVIGVAP